MNIGKKVAVIDVQKSFPLTAFRGWDKHGPYALRSVSRHAHSRWTRYKQSDHVPAVANDSGLWAFASYHVLNGVGLVDSSFKGKIQGRVKLWGTVVKHEHGYRAQFAEIDGLIVRRSGDTADWYAHMLGVKRLKEFKVTRRIESVSIVERAAISR